MANTSIIRQVRRKTQPSARCRRSTAQPFKKRTAGINGDGFLKHCFQPFWAYSGNWKRAEKEFFRSLSNICSYYDLSLPDVTGYVFPQNIYHAWEIIAQEIKDIDNKLDCIILCDKKHKATLATTKQLNTGSTLYYIPVRPLWQWAQNCEQQAIAELVLVIFAYLHQVVQIPFYTQDGSYLGQQYEILDQWLNDEMSEDENEEEKEYREYQLDELYTLTNAGTHLYRQVNNPYWLTQMESIVLNFRHANKWDLEWELLGIEFLQLYQQYPKRSVFDNIRPDLFYPEEEERITATQYISFYWSGNDCFYDTLEEMINCNFQEIAITDEPITVQLFDNLPESLTEDFDFETRLFVLLNRLSQQLNDYDHEERK